MLSLSSPVDPESPFVDHEDLGRTMTMERVKDPRWLSGCSKMKTIGLKDMYRLSRILRDTLPYDTVVLFQMASRDSSIDECGSSIFEVSESDQVFV